MKVSEMKKILRAHGCYLLRQGSNHEIWYNPISNFQFQIPRHNSQELPIGTQNAILKSAGIKS